MSQFIHKSYDSFLVTCAFSFRRLPPYSDIHHFPNGVSDLSGITGKEQGTILRVR